MKKVRSYFTLAVQEPQGKWSPQFGDYDRDLVVQELQDQKSDWPKGTHFKVVHSGPSQSEINAKIAAMNAGAKA